MNLSPPGLTSHEYIQPPLEFINRFTTYNMTAEPVALICHSVLVRTSHEEGKDQVNECGRVGTAYKACSEGDQRGGGESGLSHSPTVCMDISSLLIPMMVGTW